MSSRRRASTPKPSKSAKGSKNKSHKHSSSYKKDKRKPKTEFVDTEETKEPKPIKQFSIPESYTLALKNLWQHIPANTFIIAKNLKSPNSYKTGSFVSFMNDVLTMQSKSQLKVYKDIIDLYIPRNIHDDISNKILNNTTNAVNTVQTSSDQSTISVIPIVNADNNVIERYKSMILQLEERVLDLEAVVKEQIIQREADHKLLIASIKRVNQLCDHINDKEMIKDKNL